MTQEIKKWITSLLLKWAFNICPEGKFKTKFALFIQSDIMNL